MAQNLSHIEVKELAEKLTQHVANEIASAIDAGSERDAVEEDLAEFFYHYVLGWSNNPEIVTTYDKERMNLLDRTLRKLAE